MSPRCALEVGVIMISDRHRATGSSRELNIPKADENALLSVKKQSCRPFLDLGEAGSSPPLCHIHTLAVTSGSLCSAHGRVQLREAALLCSLTPWD